MEPTPDRKIGGLSARKSEPDLSGMLAKNRPTPPPPAPEDPADAPTVPETPAKEASKPTAPKELRKPVSRASATADSPKEQISAYVNADLRNRARAAYKATGHLEGDSSWSAFVETAILAETTRRENAHNGGNAYSGDSTKLTPGRPLS